MKKYIVAALAVIISITISEHTGVGVEIANAANTCRAGNWHIEYFANRDLAGKPAGTKCANAVPNHDWGDGSPAGLPVDSFSVRWTATVQFPAGLTTFTTVTDDGVRLLVDGVRLIDDWTFHAPKMNVASTTLAAGAHTVVMEYFEGGGGAQAKLSWTDGSTPLPPQIGSFLATPPQIAPGESATLSWASTNAASCTASGGWNGSRPLSGSLPVQPGFTTTYILTCVNSIGQAATAATTVTVSGGTGNPNTWVSAYYAGYFWDWTGSDPTVALNAVDMSTMTHFIFARYSPGGGAIGGSFGQLVPGAGTGHQFVEGPFIAKAHASGVKAIMMVGGAGDGAGWDGSTANPATRTAFINAIVAKMAEKNYDGVDIDWEENWETPAQKAQILAFLAELRAAANAHPHFQAPHAPVIITWPGFWGNINYPTVTPWHVQVASLVDQYNLMTYSMAGAWGGWDSWHHSPLAGAAPSHPTSIESSIQEYAAAGVPRSKLGVGVGLYGIYYRPNVTGPRQPLGASQAQIDDNENNYRRLAQDGAFSQPGGVKHWDDIAKQSYYSYSPAWNRWGNTPITYLTYEDEQSIAAKGTWAKANGLGGGMIWTINYGYLGGTAGNPMMRAVKQAFLASNTASTAPTLSVSTAPTLSAPMTSEDRARILATIRVLQARLAELLAQIGR